MKMKIKNLLMLLLVSVFFFSCNVDEETNVETKAKTETKNPVPSKLHDRSIIETGTPPPTIEVENATARIGENNSLGIWLYYIQQTGYSSHAALAAKLKSLKIKRIYVKVGDGGYNPTTWPENDDVNVVNAYKAQGIEVYAWSYNYPGNEAAQAKVLYQAAKAGYEGFVTDIEIEFDGKTTELTNICSAFKAQKTRAITDGFANSNFKLYCTTWGNPKDHGMRVDIIDQYVDGHMPQTYLEVWGSTYMQNPTQWVNSGTAEYRSLGCVKPIHHIVSAEKNIITSAQINSFISASGAETSLWRVPGGGTDLSIWNTLQNVNWDVSLHPQPTGTITVNAPASITVGAIATISGTCSSNVKKVNLIVDSLYNIGEAIPTTNGTWTYSYPFTSTGNNRVITAKGSDVSNTVVATASRTINVIASTSTITTTIPANIKTSNYMFTGTATSDIAKVEIFIDSFPIGSPTPTNGNWSTIHTFTDVDIANGRLLTIRGLSSNGTILVTKTYSVNIVNSTSNTITANIPANITAGVVGTFNGTASANIATVEVLIDIYPIGTATTSGGTWSSPYNFSSVDVANGRTITLKGKSSAGTVLVTKTYTVNIVGNTPNPTTVTVPYFYQYNNSINPSGSCQNTTMAMVLKYYLKKAGNTTAANNMTPDYISSYWGTSQAQSVSGYQSVFNTEAAHLGLSVRDAGTTNMSLSTFRSQAALGKPVVVHGYFTSYGHVITVLGYDGTYYYCNDPAGKWSQTYAYGGYSTVNSTEGINVKYSKAAFEAAIYDGVSIWAHIFN
jgi:Peptidase_C39 like family